MHVASGSGAASSGRGGLGLELERTRRLRGGPIEGLRDAAGLLGLGLVGGVMDRRTQARGILQVGGARREQEEGHAEQSGVAGARHNA